MEIISKLSTFEWLIDYGRSKLATDVDDYAIEWLRQCGLIDRGNNATDEGRRLLNFHCPKIS